MNNTFSASGVTRLSQLEGCRLVPYQDGAGVWTDGYGNTHGVVPHGPAISEGKALADLQQNAQSAAATVNAHVSVKLTQNQFDALVIFVFNVGAEAFINSTLLRLLNSGNYNSVPLQLMRWDKIRVGSKMVPSHGLTVRRSAECTLWSMP